MSNIVIYKPSKNFGFTQEIDNSVNYHFDTLVKRQLLTINSYEKFVKEVMFIYHEFTECNRFASIYDIADVINMLNEDTISGYFETCGFDEYSTQSAISYYSAEIGGGMYIHVEDVLLSSGYPYTGSYYKDGFDIHEPRIPKFDQYMNPAQQILSEEFIWMN